MTRRFWALMGMIGISPCLLFTLWTLFLAFYTAQFALFGSEQRIENKTEEAIWVTPQATSDKGAARLPHQQSRLLSFASLPGGEVLVPAGESRILIIDTWIMADIGGPLTMVIRTERGDVRTLTLGPQETPGAYLISDVKALPPATDAQIAELFSPRGEVNFGFPTWLIITLGVAAPVALLKLRRVYRKSGP